MAIHIRTRASPIDRIIRPVGDADMGDLQDSILREGRGPGYDILTGQGTAWGVAVERQAPGAFHARAKELEEAVRCDRQVDLADRAEEGGFKDGTAPGIPDPGQHLSISKNCRGREALVFDRVSLTADRFHDQLQKGQAGIRRLEGTTQRWRQADDGGNSALFSGWDFAGIKHAQADPQGIAGQDQRPVDGAFKAVETIAQSGHPCRDTAPLQIARYGAVAGQQDGPGQIAMIAKGLGEIAH